MLNRRKFVGVCAAAGAGSYFVNPGFAAESTSPNERLNLACVGSTNRAGANIAALKSQNIVAIADIDSGLLDKGSAPYPGARKYRDFRIMLEKEAEKVDAVVVGTPDHTHAPAAAMAMRMGKHCYCEKPLTHTVQEARVLAELAVTKKLKTQLGTQIHSLDNYRRVVEAIQGGVIGSVKEAHVWSNAKYTGGKLVPAEKPRNVDWDLWLGPASERDYCQGIHPFNWRKYWDYGTGALGDFGCHYMDLTHWALKLRHPDTVSARGNPLDPITPPAWCIVDYEFPARGSLPAVKLTWYDGGKRPAKLAELKDKNGAALNWSAGQLFVGDQGMILSNYTNHIILPEEKFADVRRPVQSIPKSIGHHNEWVRAIKEDRETTCNFDYSGALTECVLLGVASFRSQQPIEWDAVNLKVKNDEGAQEFIHKEYRKGWTL
ncbi:MAG: Gfo/Idh/MocA family oxidoreductase [Planctomycetota bacterium]|jgi:predicted dehydrogenase|nr:Gfo/Idh/MocA family oxidoreductase [Planctomycetota bacterium]